MRLSYHPETDSLYIHLSERPGADVIGVAEGFAVDVDAEGVPVGIEIEGDASRMVDLSVFEVEGVSLASVAFKSRDGEAAPAASSSS